MAKQTREERHMALTQCNFRIPAWQKRKISQFAEMYGKTLEGFLQDEINNILDARIEDLDTEARIISDFVSHSRTRAKYRQIHDGGKE